MFNKHIKIFSLVLNFQLYLFIQIGQQKYKEHIEVSQSFKKAQNTKIEREDPQFQFL